MTRETIIQHRAADYNVAVQVIKDAILRSQYQAARLVNREMLSLYYGIGRYVSEHSRHGFWGTSAIETISERLRKELPGLKGFSKSNIKNMRMFYEEWSQVFDSWKISESNSPAMADEIHTDLLLAAKSPAMVSELENYLSLSFSHHIIILTEEKYVIQDYAVKQLSKIFGKSKTSMFRIIDKLKADGKIRRLGSEKSGTWEVVE